MGVIINLNRGYAIVGLTNPKSPVNVGTAMHACGAFGASAMYYTGHRYKKSKAHFADPSKSFRHTPLLHCKNLRNQIPLDCVPVAVEITAEAEKIRDRYVKSD